jgi:hypothetical protein
MMMMMMMMMVMMMMMMMLVLVAHDCDAVFRYHLACVVDDVSVSPSPHLPNRTYFQPSFRSVFCSV